MTPADGSPSRACSLPGFVPLAVQGREARHRRGARRGQPAPPPGSAKAGSRRITARYDGALTSASPSTGKDPGWLTGPVHRPAPADPDTPPPARRPIEAQLRAGMARGAQREPGPDDVIGARASPAPRPAGLAMLQPQFELFQAGDSGAGAGFKPFSPASSCARSCDPRRKERTPDTAVTPGVWKGAKIRSRSSEKRRAPGR
jgi:hypothetical protein